jgi:hypothetical protein
MYGDAQIMEASGENDDNFRIMLCQSIVIFHAGFDPRRHQQSQDFDPRVGHNMNMRGSMVADATTIHRVDVNALPQLFQLNVLINT